MLTVKSSTIKVLVYLLVLAATFSTACASAQTLEHVQQFWAFNGVEFLPGGYVEEASDETVTRYRYNGTKFEPYQGELPSLIQDWMAFDWDVDYLDQVDVSHKLNSNLGSFLPKRAKVKKVYEIELPGKKSDLALICYTRQLRIEGSNTQAIYVIAAVNTNPSDSRSQYRKLWTRKLRSQTNYGAFQYQSISGLGAFFLLYTQDAAGDAVNTFLDVYRMRALESDGIPKRKHGAAPKKTPTQ